MRRLSIDVKEGHEFSGTAKYVSEARMRTFSGGALGTPIWPAKNIHTDWEAARSVGLRAPVVSGAQTQGYLVELMVDLFGMYWLNRGSMNIVFTTPVYPGTTVVSKAVVKASQRNQLGLRLDLDIWCEDQYGKKVTVGTAIGWLP